MKNYQQLISEGVQTLPPEAQEEILDFVYFIRKKCLQPQRFKTECYENVLQTELKLLNTNEQIHLEQEFADYEQLYPHE